MYLIVGLGNPGKEYEKTRHNAGFWAIDRIVEEFEFPALKEKREFEGSFSKGTIQDEGAILLKPHTYMNLSGRSVQKVAHYYQVEPQNIIVIHDDIDLALGKIRIRKDGSSGGHNGIKSVMSVLGEHFIRIKIGAGTERDRSQTVDYVLSGFNKEEAKIIQEIIQTLPDIISCIIQEGVEKAQNKFN